MAHNPVQFSQALADEICERLSTGERLSAICDEEGMPTRQQVYGWRRKNAVFAAQYEDALAAYADVLFEEILDIADDGRNDWYETMFGPRLNKEAVARSNVRIKARENLIAKLNPKRYGEKSQLDLTNSDGSMKVSQMSDEAKAARIEAIYRAAAARRDARKAAKPDPLDGSDLV